MTQAALSLLDLLAREAVMTPELLETFRTFAMERGFVDSQLIVLPREGKCSEEFFPFARVRANGQWITYLPSGKALVSSREMLVAPLGDI